LQQLLGRNASVRPCIIIAALFIATSTRPSSATMRSTAARQLASSWTSSSSDRAV